MNKPNPRFLFTLLGLAAFCTATASSHRLMDGMALFWGPCCDFLTLMVPPVVTTWLSALTRGGMIIVLISGIYHLIRRLWHSYRFLARLNFVSGLDHSFSLPPHVTSLCAELGVTQGIMVLSTQVPLAFCFGLLRPRICVSTGLLTTLTNKELKAVLLHEYHHQLCYDPLRTLVADGIASLLFFLPVVAEWRDLFRTATEIAADRYAIRSTGRSPLAGALHKLLTHPLAVQDSFLPSGITGIGATEARMAYLLDEIPLRWRFSPQRLLMSTASLLLFCQMLQIVSL